MQRRTPHLALALTVALALSACGGDDGDATGDRTTTTTAAPRPALSATVDWTARTVEVEGDTPFDVAFCEGEGPFLCISRDGEALGAVEYGTYPDVVDLGAWSDQFYGSIAGDRAEGCPGYVFTPDRPVDAPFAGRDGIRYGFTGTVDGARIERVIGHAFVEDGSLHLLTANALADDGCLSREGELPVDAIDDLAPLLAALAAGSALPGDAAGGSALADTFTGFLASLDPSGTIGLDLATMLTGEEAKAAAAEDGETMEGDFYIDNDDPAVAELTVGDDMTVELYDCSAACELRAVATDDFMTGAVTPYGGEHALVEVVVEDGALVALREIYLP